MRRLALVAGLALLVPGTATAVVHAPRPSGASAKKWGASLYAANCERCHGPSGVGEAPKGPNGGPSLRGVGALAPDFYLRTGYMPLSSVGLQPHSQRVEFSQPEIDALVAYVASLGPGPPVPKPQPERGSVAQGFQLFTQHCAGCHQVVAQGGYVKGAVVPPLGGVTSTEIAEAVRVGPYLMPRFSPKAISNAQLDSIVAYVRYTQHPDNAGGWSIGLIGPVPEGLVAWLIAGVALVGVCVVIGERLRRE